MQRDADSASSRPDPKCLCPPIYLTAFSCIHNRGEQCEGGNHDEAWPGQHLNSTATPYFNRRESASIHAGRIGDQATSRCCVAACNCATGFNQSLRAFAGLWMPSRAAEQRPTAVRRSRSVEARSPSSSSVMGHWGFHQATTGRP